jgi:LacI family transcriptional regulator
MATITIKDIAKSLGVSHVTVSKALRNQPPISEKTCLRVKQAAEQMGYKPNLLSRGLKTGKAQVVGTLMTSPDHEVTMMKFGAIADQAVKHGFSLFSGFSSKKVEREKSEIQELLGRQVDGLIIFPLERNDPTHFINLIKEVPVVFLEAQFSFPVNCVNVDYVNGGYQAVSHMIKQGRRKPAFLAGGTLSFTIKERIQGWRQGCQEAGLDFSSLPFFFTDLKDSPEDMYQLANALIESGRSFDAIVCSNDVIAANAMRALYEHGFRVPDDVALIGFDNNMFGSCLSVPLTTFAQPIREIGEAVFNILYRHIENPSAPFEQVVLKPQIVIRNSTGCNIK